jgi:hypothetical protein
MTGRPRGERPAATKPARRNAAATPRKRFATATRPRGSFG